MKYIKLIIILYIMVLGCEKKDDNSADIKCLWASSFFEGVSRRSNSNDTYVIKGIVLDKIEHELNGLNIKLIEDLKGNFPEKVNDFTAWGVTYADLLRKDYLSLYDKQDVLIMHLTRSEGISPEKSNDYCTITCTHSVVKLSDDYVTGRILYDEEGWWEGMSLEDLRSYAEISQLREQQNITDTIPFDDFQKKLNELLNQKK